jgi:hypothetical protein
MVHAHPMKNFALQVQFVPHRKHLRYVNRLMLFREMIAVYCENHTEHIKYVAKCRALKY